MYGSPVSNTPVSNTRTTCSLFTRAHATASRANRSSAPAIAFASLRKNLIATRCASPRCVASMTTPIPPCPMTRSTRYFPPSTAPIAGSAIGDGVESAITVGAEPVVEDCGAARSGPSFSRGFGGASSHRDESRSGMVTP